MHQRDPFNRLVNFLLKSLGVLPTFLPLFHQCLLLHIHDCLKLLVRQRLRIAPVVVQIVVCPNQHSKEPNQQRIISKPAHAASVVQTMCRINCLQRDLRGALTRCTSCRLRRSVSKGRQSGSGCGCAGSAAARSGARFQPGASTTWRTLRCWSHWPACCP
eukprot:2901805-Rhodomonas_salina.1